MNRQVRAALQRRLVSQRKCVTFCPQAAATLTIIDVENTGDRQPATVWCASGAVQQNRFSVLLGYSASKKINFELGYLYQILQQGKPLANNSVVMQHNSGFISAAQFSF